ncbi:MAG TPA: hypothetical protein VIL97_05215, partial [Thermoanaerobaculia bacterium]
IFIAAKEQKFVVLGDRGIHEKVGPQFWEEIAGVMTDRFRSGQFTEGIVEAIRLAGSQLYAFFPYSRADRNELPNEVSLGTDQTLPEKRE